MSLSEEPSLFRRSYISVSIIKCLLLEGLPLIPTYFCLSTCSYVVSVDWNSILFIFRQMCSLGLLAFINQPSFLSSLLPAFYLNKAYTHYIIKTVQCWQKSHHGRITLLQAISRKLHFSKFMGV